MLGGNEKFAATLATIYFHASFPVAPPGKGIIGWGHFGPVNPKATALWPEFGLVPRTQDPEWPLLRALTRKRHGAQFNLAFCDGHVEGLKPGQAFDVRRDDVLRRWNRDNLPHRETVPPLQ